MSAWKASATGVQIANLPFDRNADPFTVVIRCTSGNGVDNKTEDGCDVLGLNHGF